MDGSVKMTTQLTPFGEMSYIYTNIESIQENQEIPPIYERPLTQPMKHIEIMF